MAGEATTTDITPGTQTTEFKLTAALAVILGLVGAFKPDLISADDSAKLIAGIVAAYTVGRSIVKAFAVKK